MNKQFKISVLSKHQNTTSIELDRLRAQGYAVDNLPLLPQLPPLQNFPDLFIVEGSDTNSLNLVQQIRSQSAQVGVMVTTSPSGHEDRLNAFLSGADNCIANSYALEELLVMVASLRRRLQWQAELS
jgi:DNA-binding response OmpR family regulator